MTNIARDRKKSNFLQETSIPAGATFDFVYNGTNYKIPVESLIASFGATGALTQIGDPTQIPILNKNGSVNEIRNLEDGSGVKASISPLGGAKLSHNLTVDSTGVPIMLNKTAVSPDLVSLTAGVGMNIVASGKTIKFTATGITVAANVIVVNQMSDFPTAVGSVITLTSNTAYLVSANLSTSNRFVFGDNTLVYGPGREVSGINYTGSGVLFTATNVSAKIEKLALSCASGTLINVSGTGTESFRIADCGVSAVATIGTVSGMQSFALRAVTFKSITTNGILFSGALGFLFFGDSSFTILAGTCLDFGSAIVSGGIRILTSVGILGAGTYFLDGSAASANIGTGHLGAILASAMTGAGTTLGPNVSIADTRWFFMGNDSVPDTKSGALMQLTSNTTNTVIAVSGTPVLVAGAWVQKKAVRFATNAAGKITYTAERTLSSPITVTATGAPVSGVNKTITYHLYINGVSVGAEQLNIISSGSPKNTTLLWGHAFVEGDYVELYVSNETDTIDVLVQSAVFRVS